MSDCGTCGSEDWRSSSKILWIDSEKLGREWYNFDFTEKWHSHFHHFSAKHQKRSHISFCPLSQSVKYHISFNISQFILSILGKRKRLIFLIWQWRIGERAGRKTCLTSYFHSLNYFFRCGTWTLEATFTGTDVTTLSTWKVRYLSWRIPHDFFEPSHFLTLVNLVVDDYLWIFPWSL